jgi:hypothetical protein
MHENLGSQFTPYGEGLKEGRGAKSFLERHKMYFSSEGSRKDDQRMEEAGQNRPEQPEIREFSLIDPLFTDSKFIDKNAIDKYMGTPNAQSEGSSADLPEVYSHGGVNWINDGRHRILASRMRGDKTIKVKFWNGETEW